MLGIRKLRDVEERLVISVGIESSGDTRVSGVSKKSPAFDTIDRVTDVDLHTREEDGDDIGGVYGNVSGLNVCS